MLLPASPNEIEKCFEIATILRNQDIKTEVYLNDKKLKAKFKYADKLKVPYTIVIGEEEVASGKVTLKNMQTGEQQKLTVEQVIAEVTKK